MENKFQPRAIKIHTFLRPSILSTSVIHQWNFELLNHMSLVAKVKNTGKKRRKLFTQKLNGLNQQVEI